VLFAVEAGEGHPSIFGWSIATAIRPMERGTLSAFGARNRRNDL